MKQCVRIVARITDERLRVNLGFIESLECFEILRNSFHPFTTPLQRTFLLPFLPAFFDQRGGINFS